MREDYERFHAALEDAELDAIARIAGFASGIGRMGYMDDATLEAIAREAGIAHGSRVLDLGCGRGFLGRWFLANGYRVDYTAVDYSANALEAVRRNVAHARCVRGDLKDAAGGPYDAIFAIESLWSADGPMSAKVRELLEPGGSFLMTIASLDATFAGRVDASLAGLEGAALHPRIYPLAAGHAAIAGRLCAATMLEPPKDPWVRERLLGEAAATLAALRKEAFNYCAILARRE